MLDIVGAAHDEAPSGGRAGTFLGGGGGNGDGSDGLEPAGLSPPSCVAWTGSDLRLRMPNLFFFLRAMPQIVFAFTDLGWVITRTFAERSRADDVREAKRSSRGRNGGPSLFECLRNVENPPPFEL